STVDAEQELVEPWHRRQESGEARGSRSASRVSRFGLAVRTARASNLVDRSSVERSLAIGAWAHLAAHRSASEVYAALSPHAPARINHATAMNQSTDRIATRSSARSQGAGVSQPANRATIAPTASATVSGR